MGKNMINFIASAIEVVGWLNSLAKNAANGFFPFSKCSAENKDQWEDAIVYLDDPDDGTVSMAQDDVIADSVVEDVVGHHDAVSCYGEILSQLCDGDVRVAVEHCEDGYEYVRATFECYPGPLEIIIDEDGWRIA